MARRRFRIFGKGADEGDGGPRGAEPSAEARTSSPPRPVGSDARDWTVGQDSAGPAAPASTPEVGAEALVPRELQANGASQSPPPPPDASEWLPGGDETSRAPRAAPEAPKRPAAELSGRAESTSIEAMAAEAESLAADSKATHAAEPVLEPPPWVAAAPPEASSDPEPAAETKPEPEARVEPEPKAEPEPRQPSPAATDDDGAENRVSLSRADFDELRELGMSVTQAKRVIRYRDERNGFRTLDELDQVPGFPRSFLSGVKERVVP